MSLETLTKKKGNNMSHIVNPTIETLFNSAHLEDTIECNFKTYTVLEVTPNSILIGRVLHNRHIDIYIKSIDNDPNTFLAELSITDKDDDSIIRNKFKKELRIAQIIHFLGYRGIKLINEVFCPS